MCVLRWVFPLDFWRKSRTKRSFWRLDAQPSAEIVRVECAKCRRECDLSHVRATLCGDRACRVREMQARVRFVPCARNPLRRSCVSSARNAGESAICPMRAQPSAEIVRVECAKCRRECDLSHARATVQPSAEIEQPSAEIVRVERAKCRRECDLSGAQPSAATVVRVERAKCRRALATL